MTSTLVDAPVATAATGEAVTRRAIALERTLQPRSIAILGASAEPSSVAGNVLANLKQHGFQGELHLISRSRDEIQGHACIKSLEELPHGVDVVVFCIPEAGVYDAVRLCAERGVGGVVIFASGYAETGEEGRTRQEAIAQLAQDAGMVLIGPNCMGYTSYTSGVPVTFEPMVPQYRLEGRAGASVVAQSGAMAANLRDSMLARWVPIAHVASTGNEAVVAVEDYVAYYIDDPHTAVIGVYAEQIRHPQLFLQLAARAREKGKPIVLLMPGRSERAREAAASHTGALASDYASAAALLRGEAVVLVETQDELYDVLAVLVNHPQPVAGGVSVVTGSGAIKSLSIDFADSIGLELPHFAPETVRKLTELLPDYAVAENPLDYTTVIMKKPTIVIDIMDVVAEDPNVGSMVLPMITGPEKGQQAKAKNMVPALANRSKPAVLVALGDTWPISESVVAVAQESGIAVFRSLERALRALHWVGRYAADLQRAKRRAQQAQAALALPGTIPPNGMFAEWQGKQWLQAAGLSTPKGKLARTVDEALAIAEEIGYPVVIKAQASELPHKSDVGGVMVGLADKDALSAGWQTLQGNLKQHRPDLTLDGVLVEAMGNRGLELVVGARRDPQWGPIVLVGLGGIWIEALKDVRLMPPDLAVEDIVAELNQLKAAPVLHGLRGAAGVDLQAVAKVVATLGAQMLAQESIAEVDINPLVAYPDGVVALDALLVCEPAAQGEQA